MLETTECIQIENNGRNYTDCMEFSLLRFLHLIMYSRDEIDLTGISHYKYSLNQNLNLSGDLLEYINSNPEIHQKSVYYTQSEGVHERGLWAKFVSDRDFFQYYRTDGAELFTNIDNIIIFCNRLLGINLDLNQDNEYVLQELSSKLSTKNKKIIVSIKSHDIILTRANKSSIIAYLSKEQEDIENLPNKMYPIVNEQTLLNLQIGLDKYEWHLYGIYFKDKSIVSNNFITGHSVIMLKN